jgi:hypothetical protein
MRKSQTAFIFVLLAAALLLDGCGDFWQNPNGTSTGTTASTTTLAVSSSTVTTGTSITLTATVTPTAATGTVTFLNNGSSIGTGALSSGTATLSTSFTTAGTASLTATYGGNSTYASSTSGAVSVTVTTAADGKRPATSAGTHASGIHTTGVFSSSGGTFIAPNSEAAIAEAGSSVTLTETSLSGSAGNGRGVLLRNLSSSTAKIDPGKINFEMTGGSLTYNCDATSAPTCAEGSASKGQNNPATLFSVADTVATISLAGVKVTNNTPTAANSNGTLLTVQSSARATPAHATLAATGTSLTGDAILDDRSSAALEIFQDNAGTGSSLTGAINSAHRGHGVSLALDKQSMWTVTATSYLTTLNGLDLDGATVNNIDGGGHCVFYSGSVNGSASSSIYALAGGGNLAPVGSTGLDCK